ncbi:hypothetical protein F5B20DRAFT_574225 [Whalleya microplaca]|nr:hypothetical protein F5B20DRAFT_574225 [Whalleya microplaca]
MPLRPAVSAAARRTMKTAFDELEQTITLDDSRGLANMSLENLAARQSLCNMRRLMPLFKGLEHYSNAIDILCNGTPYMAWIWSPITLILRIASEYVGAFEQITRQNFHKNAYKFVRRNSWKLLFLTCWANAHNISEAREMREDIKTWREDSLAKIKQLNEKESNKQFESIITWLKADESDQLTIYDAISSEGSKSPGTCSWVLKSQKVKSWLQQTSDSSVLWLQGPPGSGKSVLAGQITQFMKSANMLSIQHFCSQGYASSTTYDQILRSLLLQLLRKDDELVAHVHKDCVLGKKPPTVKALEKLLLTLLTIMSNGPRQTKYVWVLIDGLNECDSRKQTSVLSLINQIAGKTPAAGGTVCKVLISSRPSSLITKGLRMRQIFSLSGSKEKKSLKFAIRQYVLQRLQPLHEKLRQLELGPNEIGDIGKVIANKSDGTLDLIQWTTLLITLPVANSKSLLSYQKILTQILVRLDPRSVDRLKCIFGWIAFSKRPLKRMEFLSALTFSSSDPAAIQLVPSYVLDTCGPLVEEKPDTTLTFIHISVKEFLQSSSSNFTITEKETIAEHCTSTVACLLSGIDFLRNGAEPTRTIRVAKGIHGLHVYATEFWTEYVLHCADLGAFGQDSSPFMLTSELAQKLDEFLDTSVPESHCIEMPMIDDRLRSLKDQTLILKHVEASLRARSLKRLETSILSEAQAVSAPEQQAIVYPISHNSGGLGEAPQNSEYSFGKDGISLTLSSYQEIVRYLLKQDYCPGVSATDLELFKNQFKSSAFTCRLSFCPRATLGFVSEELRRQHEIAHTRLTMCTVPECRYPPFVSVKALKNHLNKYHTYKPIHMSKGNTQHTRTSISNSAQPGRPGSSEEIPTWAETEQNAAMQHFDENMDLTPGFNPDGSESMHVALDSIGFLACSISGCRQRLHNELPLANEIYHYWDWHHADSIARCAVHRCQRTFGSRANLQAHYKSTHTIFLCHNCEDKDQEGFALEDELRQHWRSYHLQRISRWRYDRPYDALKHLKTVHFGKSVDSSWPPFSELEDFVTEVWLYKAENYEQTSQRHGKVLQWGSDESDEESQVGLDDMFYVEELA